MFAAPKRLGSIRVLACRCSASRRTELSGGTPEIARGDACAPRIYSETAASQCSAFYFAYRYGMSFSQACAAPFWFPDSVLLCALLLTQPRYWWFLVVAVLPIRLFVGFSFDVPLWFLLGAFAIDSAKGLLTAAILRRFLKNPLRLETVREFGVFCLFAVLLIPAASAFAGAALRHAHGYAYWPAWEQWFLGNVLTHLVVTPAIFYLVLTAPWKMSMPSTKRWVEGGLLTAGLILTGHAALAMEPGEIAFTEPRFYAPVPFLFWAAIRFGMFGATGAIAILAFLSVEAALVGRGPFSGQSPADTALALQQFSAAAGGSALSGRDPYRAEKGDDRSLREREALNRGIMNSLTSLVVIVDRSGALLPPTKHGGSLPRWKVFPPQEPALEPTIWKCVGARLVPSIMPPGRCLRVSKMSWPAKRRSSKPSTPVSRRLGFAGLRCWLCRCGAKRAVR